MEMICTCSKKIHKAPLVSYDFSVGAIDRIPETLKDYNRIYMVCDTNTYEAAGKKVEEVLRRSNKFYRSLVLRGDTILPNAQTLGEIILYANNPSDKSDIFEYSPLPDLILAVSSGTINDSCRLASYRLNLPYAVVATAPSMDGYASAGSPFMFGGSKATIQCTTPKYIIGDLEVLNNAPYILKLAGIGDMFGKYTGILDWELARDYSGEYYCEKIANDVIEATNKCLENGQKIKENDINVIKNIMEGLVVTGLGMAYTGSSRPASGSEHIIEHAWELYNVENNLKTHLHGLEVCEATLLVAFMYKMLYQETDDKHLRGLIEKYLPYFEKMEEFCRKMEVPATILDRELMISGVKKAVVMRDRYTILLYLRDKNMLDTYIEKAVDKVIAFYKK